MSTQSGVESRLERLTVPALDEILGLPFRVLDDGFVRVIDYMGSDAAIVQAARVSYGAGTKKIREDRGLIRYLMRHAHTTPFEMCEIKFHIRVPMDTWRQWIRHRTANVNEYSTRYSIAIDAMQKTAPDEWRKQSTLNRQGSQGLLDRTTGEQLSAREAAIQALSREVYEERLAAGVAREQARKDLPLSTYTEAYWKTDLYNLFHFLGLRMSDQAQNEIQAYAKTIGDEIVARWCPEAWEAYRDYQMSSLVFSKAEAAIIAHLIAGDADRATAEAANYGLLSWKDGRLRSNRERNELEAKLEQLGLSAPWTTPETDAG